MLFRHLTVHLRGSHSAAAVGDVSVEAADKQIALAVARRGLADDLAELVNDGLDASLRNVLAGRGLTDDRTDARGEIANNIGGSGKSGAHRHHEASSEKEHRPANRHLSFPFSSDWLAMFTTSFRWPAY
ncbi:hypothetical protein BRAS3843_190023 [Bradyrhizobium sp. STM 3843]|nr:hypothetical protein BRAS3843_190023 [Bradyrhizobium sp. STM 3843]